MMMVVMMAMVMVMVIKRALGETMAYRIKKGTRQQGL